MAANGNFGQLLFDKTFFTTGHDEYTQAIPTADHCFMGITYTAADTGGYRSHNNLGGGDIWLCKLCYAPVGLAPQMVEDGLLLYPNPAGEDVVVHLTDGNLLSLQIADINGRKLFAQDMIKRMPAGYFLSQSRHLFYNGVDGEG
ncbi:MAG: T9SS type A sorting domain-containing protein [Bacteroidetes bacterium]|nr:T9SS type A sorting domain-containing protein [Bacteroidota bacterium]